MANPDQSVELPKTPVVCKPSEGAFEQVFKMTNINPHKTVRTQSKSLPLFRFYIITKPQKLLGGFCSCSLMTASVTFKPGNVWVSTPYG